MRSAVLAVLLLAGCAPGNSVAPATTVDGTDLESAAIRAGVIDDPAAADLTGLYAADTDRLCLVPRGGAYRVGVSVDYGDDQDCAGAGTVTRSGETLHLTFASAAGCEFDARFEGDRIVFPGALPDGCQALCARRASLAGIAVERQSDSRSEAATMRDARGQRPCVG